MKYFIFLNLFAFFLFFLDKRNAIKHKYRFSENLLLFFCTIGGCFGFYFGMIVFHHKTKKRKFVLIPFLCILYVILFIVRWL